MLGKLEFAPKNKIKIIKLITLKNNKKRNATKKIGFYDII